MDKMSSLEIAIGNEQAEMDYYRREAERSSNPVVKKLFNMLAEDEKEHMARIRELHGRLVKSGSWPEDLPIEVADTNVSMVLESLTKTRDGAAASDANDLAALRKAEQFEESGIRFYDRLAKSCTNPREQSFFKFLSSIEREHYLSIQDSIFYLDDPAGWFESRERGLLEG